MQSDNEKKEIKQKSPLYSVLVVTGSVTILLVIPVVILSLLGLWLDKFFHTGHLLLITGAVIGFVGGMGNIYRLLKTLT